MASIQPQSSQAQAAAELARRELARRRAATRYIDFLPTVAPPSWTFDVPHIRLIAQHLDAVTRGEIDRLAVFMPPRHAKTETVTIRYPVYRLEKQPTTRALVTGYNERVAHKFSRKSRNIAAGRIAMTDKTGADEWETTSGGSLVARGVGTPPTGYGFDLILIDDPVKKREEAESPVYRDKLWDWYTDDLYTRLEPGGAIILTLCMTGDTRVLMADGKEKFLSDIKPFDHIATFDNGSLAVSTVLHHRNNGPDFVYKVRTTSGIIVRANERHPFLVENEGYLQWVRLRNLNTAHRIVTVRDSGGNGRARLALNATNPSFVEDTAHLITTKKYGQMDIEPHHATLYQDAVLNLSTDTELHWTNTMQCLPLKMANVRFAKSHLGTMFEHTGAENCALITATIPAELEHYYAMIAISQLPMQNHQTTLCELQTISDFTLDKIESIEFDGVEDVYDIQVKGTENFIANGVVSHNTRWHYDDLAARAIASEPNRWTILRLPAIAEEADPMGRSVGAALWPDRYDVESLGRIREVMEPYSFEALYQQNPTPKEGSFFKVGQLAIVDAAPADLRQCRGWDFAASAGKGDYTAGVRLGVDGQGVWWVTDVRRGQWAPDERDGHLRQVAQLDGPGVKIRMAQDPGQAGVDQALRLTRMLAGYSIRSERVSGDKATRASGLAAQINAGNVRLVRGAWNGELIEELRQFPQGKNDDQVDAAADAFNELTLANQSLQGKLLR